MNVMTLEQQARIDHQRVLVVEDDQSVRRMLRFSLRSAGFDISEVSTGAEALQVFQQDVPEAIILDLGLPDGLGGSVLEWIRRTVNAPDVPLVWVIISAQDLNDVIKQYGPLGRHFLAKPFDPWVLVARLQELMNLDESQRSN
jgi:DNA-binding response OmpR family regulator